VQVRERRVEVEARGARVLVAGFSPPEALAELRRYLSLPWPILSDVQRGIYDRLGVDRTGWRHVYTARTLARYGRALIGGRAVHRPVEDTRQLGADVILVNGVARLVYRPASPDDRPTVDSLLEALDSAAHMAQARNKAAP
jgi:hypothetical protein